MITYLNPNAIKPTSITSDKLDINLDEKLAAKQDVLSPGEGISLEGNTISCTLDISGKQDKLTTGIGITISDSNEISCTLDISGKQDKLTAGDGITISNNVISAVANVDGKQDKLTAGDGINISADNVISTTIDLYEDLATGVTTTTLSNNQFSIITVDSANTSISITFADESEYTDGHITHYCGEIVIPSDITNSVAITFPDTVSWSLVPAYAAGYAYHFDILNNRGVFMAFPL